MRTRGGMGAGTHPGVVLPGYATLGTPTTLPPRLAGSPHEPGTDRSVLWALNRECVTLKRHLKSI